MDASIEQVLKDTVSSSFASKVATGREALAHLINGLREGKLNDDQIASCLHAFTRLFVSADKNCSEKEYEFFKEVVGSSISYDDFYEMTNGGSAPDFVNATFEFISILNREDRISLIIFGACLVSADGVVTYPEANLVDRILSC